MIELRYLENPTNPWISASSLEIYFMSAIEDPHKLHYHFYITPLE